MEIVAKRTRFLSLDIVRGLAALSVFLSHIGEPFSKNEIGSVVLDSYRRFFSAMIWCNRGLHAGVIVFVVLSGFCVHMPLSMHPDRLKRGFWSNYVRRRLFRIYPVILIAAMFGLLVYSLKNGFRLSYLTDIALNLSGIIAVWPVKGEIWGNPILGVVVILCLLYATYPLIVFIRDRFGWKALFCLGVLLYFFNVIFLITPGVDRYWVGRNYFAYFLYWIIGAYVIEYIANKDVMTINRQVRLVVLVGGYIFYLAFCHLVHFKGSHYAKSLVFSLLSGYLLGYIFHKERSGLFSGWFSKKLAFIGERSYSLYVMHWPVISASAMFFSRSGINNGLLKFTVIVVLVTTFTELMYRYVELPLHKYAKKSPN